MRPEPGEDGEHGGDGEHGDAGARSRRRRVVGAIALAVGAALVAAAVLVAPDRSGQADDPPAEAETATPPTTATPPAPATPPEPDIPIGPPGEPPAEWRPDILELVRFVERERELTFAHPVEVELLSDRDYEARVGGEQASLGFYDGQRIVVRGTELTPYVQGTLVHELTHAVDDQHFGIATPDVAGSPEAQLAHTMLVEGDAVRMEWAFDEMLIANGADPAEVLDEAHTGAGTPGAPGPEPAPGPTPAPDPAPDPAPVPAPGPGGTTTTTVGSRVPGPAAHRSPAQSSPGQPASPAEPYGADIPALGDAIDQSPYFVGKQLVDFLVGEGGNAAVDAAFLDPPLTTEQVLDPRAYLVRDDALPVEPPAPIVPKGDLQDQRALGALNLYLVLAAGIDPLTALDAATGWGGEAAVTYVDADRRRCVDVAIVGDTEADTAEIGEAFAAWADSGVAARAAASRRPDGAQVLTACQAGAGVTSGSAPDGTDPFAALVVAEARGIHAWLAIRDGGLAAPEAFAFGDCVVHEVSLDTLLSPPAGGGLPARAEDDLEDAIAAC